MKNKKYAVPLLLLLTFFCVTSCAPTTFSVDEYGFWSGIGHGFTLIFAIIGKIFGADLGIFAMNNSGTLYWIGYLIGLGTAFGIASEAINNA